MPLVLVASEYEIMGIYKKMEFNNTNNNATYVVVDGKLQEIKKPILLLTPTYFEHGTYEVFLEQVENSVVWHIIGSDMYIEFSDGVFSPSWLNINSSTKCKLIINRHTRCGLIGVGKLIVE